MRCLSCNSALTDFESTRKYADTGTHVDLCNYCFKAISSDVSVRERIDLMEEADTIADFDVDS